MGDRRRFEAFAALVNKQFPAAGKMEIADIAGGKGLLRAALASHGIQKITTWDKRRSVPAHKPGWKRAWFDYKTAPNDYQLVLGMHPDEGTDHIIMYAAQKHVPFAVCPCCVKPSAAKFAGERDYRAWCGHLITLARGAGMRVETFSLPMRGCNEVIIGRWEPSRN